MPARALRRSKMRYSHHIIGRNVRPIWGYSRRKQGRQTRITLDLGRLCIAVYYYEVAK